jgi:hypothetical protein
MSAHDEKREKRTTYTSRGLEPFVGVWPNPDHVLTTDEDGERLHREWLKRNRGVR